MNTDSRIVERTDRMNAVLPPQHFDELADWLYRENLSFSAAELHGALVGCLSGGLRLVATQWPALCQDILGVTSLSADATAIIPAFVDAQLNGLSASELEFGPFLPDEDIELFTRASELTLWCRGFLGGFAEAQSRLHCLDSQYDDSVREALSDLASIAQLALGAKLEGSEGSEDDYIHLVEHTKLSALTIFTEVGWVEMYQANAENSDKNDPAPENTLH